MMVVVATRVPEGWDEVAGFRGFGSHARPQPWAASKMRPRPNKPLPLIVRQHDNVGILLRQAGFYVLARTAVRVDLSEIAVCRKTPTTRALSPHHQQTRPRVLSDQSNEMSTGIPACAFLHAVVIVAAIK